MDPTIATTLTPVLAPDVHPKVHSSPVSHSGGVVALNGAVVVGVDGAAGASSCRAAGAASCGGAEPHAPNASTLALMSRGPHQADRAVMTRLSHTAELSSKPGKQDLSERRPA